MRSVVITGGGGVLGRVMARALLDAGHQVILTDVSSEALDRARDECGEAADRRLHGIVADLGTEGGCNAVVEACTGIAPIDILVNNVGIGTSAIRPDGEKHPPRIEEIDRDTWVQFFAINVHAAETLTRAFVPGMVGRGWGRVVNNTTSFRTMLRVLPYGATKAALEAMTVIWAAELRESGVTVNVLVPGGPTDTPFIADAAGWARTDMLRPEIMGPPMRWLASDHSNGFTGQRISAAKWLDEAQGSDAHAAASRPAAWPELVTDAVWVGAGSQSTT